MRALYSAALGAVLVVAGCTDPVQRRLSEGGPEESGDAPAILVGGPSKPSPTPPSPAPPLSCPAPAAPAASCDATTFTARPPPLGLYLLLDRSGSMNEPTSSGLRKWDALEGALIDFLEAPPVTELSVAAQFFPNQAPLCEPSSYESPAVSLGPVKSAASSIKWAIQSTTPEGPTPTGPALQGAIEQARRWARQQPKVSFAIVLATDGLPSSCAPLTSPALEALAAEASTASKDPPIPTFVLGILGVNDLGSGALSTLDAIARGGGTGKATRLSPDEDLPTQLAAALQKVTAARVACSFDLPSAVAKEADLGLLNVVLNGSCGRIEIPYKSGPCEGDGWRYDVDPEQGFPRAVELCSASCERYRAGDKVSLEFGCKTLGWPPG